MAIYIILALILLIALYFVISKNKTAKTPVSITTSKNFKALLVDHVVYYNNLDDEEKARFCTAIENFLSEVNIEGVGTEVSDTDRVMIASSAVIPIFGFPGWHYQNLTNIILYPDTFNNDFEYEDAPREIMGMVGGGYMNGQMLLSRTALIKGFSKNNGKENTAVHEFVHLLDNSDGATDGMPDALIGNDYAKPWLQMMHKEMHRIRAGHSDINPYATTNEAEFLAVAAEYFFEKPKQLSEKHPELYKQLSLVFNQNPAQPSVPN